MHFFREKKTLLYFLITKQNFFFLTPFYTILQNDTLLLISALSAIKYTSSEIEFILIENFSIEKIYSFESLPIIIIIEKLKYYAQNM